MKTRRRRKTGTRVTALAAVIASGLAGTVPAASAGVGAMVEAPESLKVAEGHAAFLVGHAAGTQNYVCLPSEDGVKFKLVTRHATIFDADRAKIGTHYFGPNPAEDGTIRAVWQDSNDTSRIWGRPMRKSADAKFVAPDAIAWGLVEVVGEAEGPHSNQTMMGTTYIQRVNTGGGKAPEMGCASTEDIGASAFIPYTADYIFHKAEAE